MGVKWHVVVALNLIPNDVELLSLLFISHSYVLLWNACPSLLAIFCCCWVDFLLSIYRKSLYILDGSPLSDVHIVNISSQSVWFTCSAKAHALRPQLRGWESPRWVRRPREATLTASVPYVRLGVTGFHPVVLSLSGGARVHWAPGQCHGTHGPLRDTICISRSTFSGEGRRSEIHARARACKRSLSA